MPRPNKPHLLRWLLLSALAIPLAACDVLPTGACTLIGCADGLVVVVANAPAGTLTVQARATSGADTTYTESCPGTTGCTNLVRFGSLLASEVELTITTAAGSRVRVVRPVYETSYPNGRSCGPACRNARVNVSW